MGHLAKMKTSLDGERIKNDSSFARTLENGSEFGSIAKEVLLKLLQQL